MTNLAGTADLKNLDYECYREVIDTFEGACGKMPESSYRNFKYFAEYCSVSTANKNLDLVGFF